ncbi:MAG: hypothetical protein KME03_09790 [Aphanocapsa lilacina HA4352-LM1]|nr:hypothetical protein [Aphanocapsa lilacina HA4352-LM1]
MVTSTQAVQYVEGDNKTRQAPDAMVEAMQDWLSPRLGGRFALTEQW